MAIQLRRDTAANWTSANPVLAAGQPGLETDTRKWKAGDGATAWNSLSYMTVELAWADITGKPSTFTPATHSHVIADVTGLQTALDGKAGTTHTHAISDVTGLQTALDDKAPTTHIGAGGAAHANASTSVAGFMSAADKTKLDGVASGATATLSNVGTATIDFGVFPGSNEASVSFTDATITGTAHVSAVIMSDASTVDHTAADHRYAAAFMALTAQPDSGVGGTIHARSIHKLQGTFEVSWAWSD